MLIQCGIPQSLPKTSGYYSVGAFPSNTEIGKCYGQCIIPDEYESYDLRLAVYNGSKDGGGELETVELNTAPQKVQSFKVVMDTVQTQDYEWIAVKHYKLIAKGGFLAWVEMLCPINATKRIVNQVQDKLRLEKLYNATDSTGKMDGETKEALKLYQEENALPVGGLNIKTLDAMEIRY